MSVWYTRCILHCDKSKTNTEKAPQWDPWRGESTWTAGRSAHWFAPYDRASWLFWRCPVRKVMLITHLLSTFPHHNINSVKLLETHIRAQTVIDIFKGHAYCGCLFLWFPVSMCIKLMISCCRIHCRLSILGLCGFHVHSKANKAFNTV